MWIISCSCNGKCSRLSGRGSCLCKAAKLFCMPLCTCNKTGSKVCTNRGDVEVEEDDSIAAERDLVGPVPVRRCTNPIGGGTQGRGFLEAEDRVPCRARFLAEAEWSCSRKNTEKRWIFECFHLFWNVQCEDQSFLPFSLANNFNPKPLQVQLTLGEPPFCFSRQAD